MLRWLPLQSPWTTYRFAFFRAAQYFFIRALTAFFCAAVIFLAFLATVLTCRTA